MTQLPENQQWSQPNNGTVRGNVFMSYNLDFESNRGKLRVSQPSLKVLDQGDDADFDAYAAAFVEYGNKIYAISDVVLNATTPEGTWTENTNFQSTGNTITDAVVFDSLLLYTQGDDIRSFNGSTHANWWTSTLSQSALVTGQRHLLEVGPNDKLYIVDNGNKIYVVTNTGAVSKTGAGTLDFSATPYLITCMVASSTRLWIGMENSEGGEAIIAEWDMGAQSVTANKWHPVGADAVRCIAIWNDVPIAVLSNGIIKAFNGSSFETMKGLRFPTQNVRLTSNFIHPNGWAIIDDLPHFLVSGAIETDGVSYADATSSLWNMPSGVWCLDPEIGLYHRYAVGAGTSTQADYGQVSLAEPGALYATETSKSKFIASYEYYDTSTTSVAALAYMDLANSKPSRGYWATTEKRLNQVPKTVQSFHKKLSSGDEIRIYYRQFESDTIVLNGAWSDTSHFNTTDDASNVNVGDILIIKTGEGAGAVHRIKSKEQYANTDVLEIDEANSLIATASATNTVEVLNFKRLATITGTGVDWDISDIPSITRSRKIQLLIELRQAASSTMELDYVIIE